MRHAQWLLRGRLHAEVDASFTVMAHSGRGKATDLCAALSCRLGGMAIALPRLRGLQRQLHASQVAPHSTLSPPSVPIIMSKVVEDIDALVRVSDATRSVAPRRYAGSMT